MLDADPHGRAGCFESAGAGTLFLDEVGELPPELRGDAAAGAPTAAASGTGALGALRDYERQIIVGLLQQHRNARLVAQMPGVARSTLYRKFAELRIDPAEYIRGG